MIPTATTGKGEEKMNKSQFKMKPTKTPGLKSLTLTVAGKDVVLTADEAKELRDALLALWPEPEANYWPIYIERWHDPWWYRPYTITRGSSSGSGVATWSSDTGSLSLTAISYE